MTWLHCLISVFFYLWLNSARSDNKAFFFNLYAIRLKKEVRISCFISEFPEVAAFELMRYIYRQKIRAQVQEQYHLANVLIYAPDQIIFFLILSFYQRSDKATELMRINKKMIPLRNTVLHKKKKDECESRMHFYICTFSFTVLYNDFKDLKTNTVIVAIHENVWNSETSRKLWRSFWIN